MGSDKINHNTHLRQVKRKNCKLKALSVSDTVVLPGLAWIWNRAPSLCILLTVWIGAVPWIQIKSKGYTYCGVYVFSLAFHLWDLKKSHMLNRPIIWRLLCLARCYGIKMLCFYLIGKNVVKSCLGWDLASSANIWVSTDVSDSCFSFYWVLITKETVHSSEVCYFGLFKKASRCCLSVTFNFD